MTNARHRETQQLPRLLCHPLETVAGLLEGCPGWMLGTGLSPSGKRGVMDSRCLLWPWAKEAPSLQTLTYDAT